MMEYKRDKKEYVRPAGNIILLKHNVQILNGSYESHKEIYIDEYEEERDDMIFG